jgi:inhibitor of KinA
MTKYSLTYKPFGRSAILIEWPARIDPEIIQDIMSFERVVVTHQDVADTVIAYNSLTIRYRNLQKDFSKVVSELKELYAMNRNIEKTPQKVWHIPVCYDLQFGLDLKELSQSKNLSIEEIIALHTQTRYLIYFIGFQPGFLYLGGLNSKLYTPRKQNPRLRVEKGSVGIGGEQTGVYPQDSSGGWNIIGKSPIDFFDRSKTNPCFAKAGEFIKFVAVNLETYERVLEEVQQGRYQLKFSKA